MDRAGIGDTVDTNLQPIERPIFTTTSTRMSAEAIEWMLDQARKEPALALDVIGACVCGHRLQSGMPTGTSAPTWTS